MQIWKVPEPRSKVRVKVLLRRDVNRKDLDTQVVRQEEHLRSNLEGKRARAPLLLHVSEGRSVVHLPSDGPDPRVAQMEKVPKEDQEDHELLHIDAK